MRLQEAREAPEPLSRAEGRLKLLSRVCAVLDRSDVPYALIGAGAMAVHGVGRSTLDLDLLTTTPAALDERFWSALTEGGVTADVRRGDASDPLAGVVRCETVDEAPVDVVVGRSAWQTRVLERARRMPVGEIELPVVDAADLILLKLFAGGSQDAWDIDQLLAAGDRAALISAVESRLGDLPAEAGALWVRVRGAAKA